MTARSHHAAPGPAKHLIGEDSERGGPSHASCTFGDWSADTETNLELDDKWREHRRSVGAPNRVFSDTIRDASGPDPYRRPRRRKPSVGVSVPAEYWPTW